MPRRGLTEQERADWAMFAHGITILPGHAVPDLPPEAIATPQPAPPPRAAPAPAPRKLASPLSIGDAPAGLDGGTWTRFRSGRIKAMRTLDLHGMTAERAFHAFDAFLHAAHRDRVRCVEIITGRGTGETGGVIRRELPMWLNLPALRPFVLAAAHPHAANPGAVRLLLRRPR